MTIQTTQASEATQAVASLAEAAVAASQEIQPGATVTMALNRWVAQYLINNLETVHKIGFQHRFDVVHVVELQLHIRTSTWA